MKLFTTLITILILSSCVGGPSYKGPVSDYYDGENFHYKNQKINKSFSDLLKWKFSGKRQQWPEEIKVNPVKIKEQRVNKGVVLTFINHSTFLIQIDGVNILTDPVWSRRVSPFSWVGPQRTRLPGVKYEDLPPIDIVLIGHNHYDHLDIDTLKKLGRDHEPRFIVGLGVDLLLKDNGLKNITSLGWRESVTFSNIEYHFVECQHWSARGLFDRNKTLWGSFIIKNHSKNIYFASDTGYSQHFKEQQEVYGPMDISLLPIGAYEPRWFMKSQHMNPEEAVKSHIDLKSKFSIGMHFGTFQLTDEAIDTPIKELKLALEKYKIDHKSFIAPEFGQQFRIE
ncbi:MBL fold metallo-hydrolase [Halobacteriovorax sp. HLS]|uniref:MBL fold metallo-hydrolase n=1 Tax=Halobacteriovorax sp. HLS TaxID=2234000 RepID=UPI001F4E8E71|nr:MBL fold metallo-hydrolase [Halobacteriovorax sp. HLS]